MAGAYISKEQGNYRWYVLAILTIAQTCHGIDRAIIGLVLKPLGDEFSLSGEQLGILAGLAYGIPFAIAALPFGYAVDRFNRKNLFARDDHKCQYCGRSEPAHKLSLDHVIPRSHGGPTTWENIVCCCLRCNSRKGGRTPKEARMKLLSRPTKPRVNPLLIQSMEDPRYECWKTFLPAAG